MAGKYKWSEPTPEIGQKLLHPCEIAQTFSHYTFHFTKRMCLVVDLQGKVCLDSQRRSVLKLTALPSTRTLTQIGTEGGLDGMAGPIRVAKDVVNSSKSTSAMTSAKSSGLANLARANVRQYVDDIFLESALSITLQKQDGKRRKQTMHRVKKNSKTCLC